MPEKRAEAQSVSLTSDTRSDGELISACLAGQSEAWEALLKRYHVLIYSIPVRYGFAAEEADDIYQSACVRLLEKLPDLRDTEKFRSWLLTSVARLCWRRARQKRRENINHIEDRFADGLEVADKLELADQHLAVDEQLIQIEQEHRVRLAFEQLSPRCQQLLRLLFVADPPTSYKEVATRLGLPISNIGATRARCLEKLRSLIEEL